MIISLLKIDIATAGYSPFTNNTFTSFGYYLRDNKKNHPLKTEVDIYGDKMALFGSKEHPLGVIIEHKEMVETQKACKASKKNQ